MENTPNQSLMDQATSSQLLAAHGVIQRLAAQSAACKIWSVALAIGTLLVASFRPSPDHVVWICSPLVLLGLVDGGYVAAARRIASSPRDATDAFGLLKLASLGYGLPDALRALAGTLSFSVWPYYVALAVGVATLDEAVLSPSRIRAVQPPRPVFSDQQPIAISAQLRQQINPGSGPNAVQSLKPLTVGGGVPSRTLNASNGPTLPPPQPARQPLVTPSSKPFPTSPPLPSGSNAAKSLPPPIATPASVNTTPTSGAAPKPAPAPAAAAPALSPANGAAAPAPKPE